MLKERVRKTAQGLGLVIGRLVDGDATERLPGEAPRGPDWVQADPRWIEAALGHAQAKNAGGWYALGARERFTGDGPYAAIVEGRRLVLWRNASGSLVAAPESCPHMGAPLAQGRVEGGRLACPWHGLKLDDRGFRSWRCAPVHDDGVLVWVRLETPGEHPTERPIIAPRPERFIAATIAREARCRPEDILANRLDPWHGAHFHPHSFAALTVLSQSLEVLRLRVTYKVAQVFGLGVGVEVDATFHCPDSRTIVMTIVAGDGAGSVVETHATPLGPDKTLMVETTLASSDRTGFAVARALSPLVRPFIAARAHRLWVDDLAYAERRYALRMGEV
jgi:isorenieratene synthase